MAETFSNKRIAKNTLFMYARMLVMLLVGLYTSRVVLRTLGIEDFGIYNIVGGVVILFTFINNAMTSGTQRHLSYELGKPKGNIPKIYSACLNIHIGIAVIIFLAAESIGLWFVNTQLNIPDGKMVAANWVYQFSVLGCIVSIIRVPDNATIIAYERMSFFAYMGIIESVFKLAIVYILLLFDSDKLVLYSILIFAVTLLLNLFYRLYCKKKLPSARWITVHDKAKYRELLSFSSWTMIGSVANMGQQQGLNIIINIFYGVVLNAAVGIANQLSSHITAFVGGFQQALNPQLTKSEASGDKNQQFSLICSSSKFSFFIMLAVAIPVMVNLDYLLTLWLGEYPPHTVSICEVIIIGTLIDCLSAPLWVTIFATGKIKAYQIVVSTVALLNIPVSYVGGRYGMSAEMMYVVRNVTIFISFLIRLYYLSKLIDFDVRLFLKKVVWPVIVVCVCVGFPCATISRKFLITHDFLQFTIVSATLFFYVAILIVFFGFSRNERIRVFQLIRSKIRL